MSTFCNRRRQRGAVLLEALVGVVITGLIGAGLAHVASAMMNTQRDAKVERLAIDVLGNQLQNQGLGLCSGASTLALDLPGVSSSAAADVSCTPVNASDSINIGLNGVTFAVAPPAQINLSVPATELGIRGANANGAPLLLSSKQ